MSLTADSIVPSLPAERSGSSAAIMAVEASVQRLVIKTNLLKDACVNEVQWKNMFSCTISQHIRKQCPAGWKTTGHAPQIPALVGSVTAVFFMYVPVCIRLPLPDIGLHKTAG